MQQILSNLPRNAELHESTVISVDFKVLRLSGVRESRESLGVKSEPSKFSPTEGDLAYFSGIDLSP